MLLLINIETKLYLKGVAKSETPSIYTLRILYRSTIAERERERERGGGREREEREREIEKERKREGEREREREREREIAERKEKRILKDECKRESNRSLISLEILN
jgi:hypothetical protein